MFKTAARLMDQSACRVTLGALAILALGLLGPAAVVLVAVGPREPWLLAIGLAGITGLLGGSARLVLGPKFFLLGLGTRATIASAIGLGVMAASIAAFSVPGNFYLALVALISALAGLVMLTGSVHTSSAGA